MFWQQNNGQSEETKQQTVNSKDIKYVPQTNNYVPNLLRSNL